jgi:hypothetical protein
MKKRACRVPDILSRNSTRVCCIARSKNGTRNKISKTQCVHDRKGGSHAAPWGVKAVSNIWLFSVCISSVRRDVTLLIWEAQILKISNNAWGQLFFWQLTPLILTKIVFLSKNLPIFRSLLCSLNLSIDEHWHYFFSLFEVTSLEGMLQWNSLKWKCFSEVFSAIFSGSSSDLIFFKHIYRSWVWKFVLDFYFKQEVINAAFEIKHGKFKCLVNSNNQ